MATRKAGAGTVVGRRSAATKPVGKSTEQVPQQEGERREYDVAPNTFIEIWQTSSTAEEAANRLGMPKPIAHARATNYRRMGVKLKAMPRVPSNRKKIDVDALNSLIASLEGAACDSGPSQHACDLDDGAKSGPRSVDPKVASDIVERVVEDIHERKTARRR